MLWILSLGLTGPDCWLEVFFIVFEPQSVGQSAQKKEYKKGLVLGNVFIFLYQIEK